MAAAAQPSHPADPRTLRVAHLKENVATPDRSLTPEEIAPPANNRNLCFHHSAESRLTMTTPSENKDPRAQGI